MARGRLARPAGRPRLPPGCQSSWLPAGTRQGLWPPHVTDVRQHVPQSRCERIEPAQVLAKCDSIPVPSRYDYLIGGCREPGQPGRQEPCDTATAAGDRGHCRTLGCPGLCEDRTSRLANLVNDAGRKRRSGLVTGKNPQPDLIRHAMGVMFSDIFWPSHHGELPQVNRLPFHVSPPDRSQGLKSPCAKFRGHRPGGSDPGTDGGRAKASSALTGGWGLSRAAPDHQKDVATSSGRC